MLSPHTVFTIAAAAAAAAAGAVATTAAAAAASTVVVVVLEKEELQQLADLHSALVGSSPRTSSSRTTCIPFSSLARVFLP